MSTKPIQVIHFLARHRALVNKHRALALLSGLLLAACGPLDDPAPGSVGARAPFSIEEVPANAPVHQVSVKFPLDWERKIISAREYKGFLVDGQSILGKVGELPEADEKTVRAQALPDGPTWKNKTITYWVDGGLSASDGRVIRDAAGYYNMNTVVRWTEVKAEADGMVKFSSNGETGSSGVTDPDTDRNGNIVGATIKLSSSASASTVRHEMMHALGFRHEQKRPDRNTYLHVTVSTPQSDIDYSDSPIGHYDLVSKVHYDYSYGNPQKGTPPDFQFSLRDDQKVQTLFMREVRRYNNLSKDPGTDEQTVRDYVGKGDKLSYLDMYALKLKYTVSPAARPFTVTATEETNPARVANAALTRGQKLLRLAIQNNSGIDAESWALRIRFGGTVLPARLARSGDQNDGMLVPNIPESNSSTAKQDAILTPMEGNSRIVQGETLNVYLVVDTGANNRLDGIAFCRLNSFDCLNTGS